MARKSKPQKSTFNPISYLKSGSARKLPIYECLIPKSWNEDKKFPILFARKHVNGNLTFVSVLVDLLCTGAKDVLFFVNEPEFIYREIIETYEDNLLVEFIPASYELIHNIIFESVAFAEEYGIAPHEDFRFVEMIMEEDTDDFPVVEVHLGKNGKAHLHLNQGDERIKYFEHQILKYGKKGTYEIFYHDGDPFLDEDLIDDLFSDSCMFWDELEWEEFYEKGDFDDLPADIIIFTLNKLPDYSYDLMKEEKLFTPFTKVKSTDLPISKSQFGAKEKERMHQLYELMQHWDSEENVANPEILEKIENELLIYPENRVIWQYKWEYYQRIEDDKKAIQIAQEMKKKFPDYLLGITCHAQSLIEMEMVDAIPDAMNNCHKIQDFDPKRKKFHKTELLSFYSPWIYYYAKTGQVRASFFLMNLLIEHEILGNFPLHPQVQEPYMEAISKVVQAFYAKVKSGYISKDKFLDMMLGSLD